MRIIRGRSNLPKFVNGSVVTLGNFDGVHLGHQMLLKTVNEEGKRLNLPTLVILFEPQPAEFFMKEDAPSRLTSLRDKYTLIKKFGIDYLYVIRFNQSLSELSAENFITRYLIDDLNVKSIVIGDDFKFGKNRAGDMNMLELFSDRYGYNLTQVNTREIENLRVSSTQVRQALAENQFAKAHRLLGRPYEISGNVIYGNQLARQMGFPTANINMNRKIPALHGVYFVKVFHKESKRYFYGVANIGIRPTINGKHAVLEVHLFDFNAMIYGDHLNVIFLKKIRDEVKFSSLEVLKEQIAQDICKAHEIKAELIN